MIWVAFREGEQVGLNAVDDITVPSGQTVSLIDTVAAVPGTEGLVTRFRFLAPAIARATSTVTPEMAQADMESLCETYALPRLPEIGQKPGQVIISLADRVVAFGEADPEATQFFEAFDVSDGTCVWEGF